MAEMECRAYVKSVKADVGKGEISITFTCQLDEENLATAQELAHYTGEDAGAVQLKVLPYQRSFLGTNVTLTNKES